MNARPATASDIRRRLRRFAAAACASLVLAVRAAAAQGVPAEAGTGGQAEAQAHTVTRADLPEAFRASLDEGRLARVAPGRTDTVDPTGNVSIRPGELLATRTGAAAEAEAAPGGRARWRLPFAYLGFDRALTRTTTYRPTYIPERRLQYRAADDRFVGSFLIGLQDLADPAAESELTAAVRLRLAGDADSMSPADVELRRTNTQLERVSVFARNVSDSLRVLIVPGFDPSGVTVWLPVEPALAFEQPPTRIQGLGVESATLVLGTRGVGPRDSFVARVSADRPGLAANRLVVADGGGTVQLRSRGVGAVTVAAAAPGFRSAQVTIRYDWPLLFLCAALAGGALGGLLAAVHAGRRRSTASTLRYVWRGLLIGLVAAVAYFGIGINLLQFDVGVQRFNEIAVFAFAMLGGLFGLPALEALAARRRGG
jgi:hypothetical protein